MLACAPAMSLLAMAPAVLLVMGGCLEAKIYMNHVGEYDFIVQGI
jgi:hypothetical protein